MDLAYAQWIQTTTKLGEPASKARTTYWLRMDPPTLVWRTEDGAGWSHDVVDERGYLHTDSHRDSYLLYRALHTVTAEDLIHKVVAPEVPAGPVFEETIDTLAVRPIFLNLRRVMRYDWEVIRNNFRIRYQVWAEPKSRRLIRKEKREFNLLSGLEFSHELHERYSYNKKPPQGTFDILPGRSIEEVHGDGRNADLWDAFAEE